MTTEKYKVPVEKLRRVCDCEEELNFCQTSMDLPSVEGIFGQDRAVQSMHFGLSIKVPGYNIFVVGPNGIGRSSYTRAIVAKMAKSGPAPYDWCYINNFAEREKPIAVSFPAGQGAVFQKDIDETVEDLKISIPKAFEESVYEQKRDSIIQDLQQQMADIYHALEQEAAMSGFAMKQVPPRFIFVPVLNGEPMPREEYEKLSMEERKAIDEKGRKLAKKLDDSLREGQMYEKQANQQMIELEKQVALSVTESKSKYLKEKYKDYPKVVEYLDNLFKDIAENHAIFRSEEAPANKALPQFAGGGEAIDHFDKYKVNVFVNNEKCAGAPVIIESNPNYYNLFGKLEYRSKMLSMSTDYTMIRPGALHKANGGYLIIDAKDVLSDPFAWNTLKKSLKYGQIEIENIGEQYRLIPAATIKPEPVPLDIKVIIICTPEIYYLLFSLDDDLQKLFKVRVDFDVEMPRNSTSLCQYASFISSVCTSQNLNHFDRSAIARIIEFGSRLCQNQNKLSTRFNQVAEIIYEAASLAKAGDTEYVNSEHVVKAIKNRRYRYNKIEEKYQEMILQKKIMIRTEGAITGQINALSVVGAGGYAFGIPSRITARTFAGGGGIINVERETRMSGSSHSKGVLILSGYLGGKFAQKKPLGLTAQITFEQSYEGVDGDSASSTELYAILSSLSGVPLKQSLAVTGSVDQHGEIQPIGGATEKIEGFFDICNERGLTGEQGVMIPVQNIDNLMLKDEIIEAVRDGKFHIYAVANIEEGIELLTGVPAGKLGSDMKYPEGTIFDLAEKKLQEFNKARSQKNQEEKSEEKKESDEEPDSEKEQQ